MKMDELIRNFRRSLVALVPCVEAVRIPWTDAEKYDEWERLAAAAFESLVVFPIRTSIEEKLWEQITFVPYEMLQPNYARVSFIEVSPSSGAEARVFYGLSTEREPFDTCRWYRVAPDGRVLSRDQGQSPLADVKFRAVIRLKGEEVRMLDDVDLGAST